ncbi:hypothetical protein AB0C74_38870 [Spirillospora sp. NPDC048832]
MTKGIPSELDRVRAAIAVSFAVLGALIMIAVALPGGWGLLVLPTVPAAPLLGALAYQGGGRR